MHVSKKRKLVLSILLGIPIIAVILLGIAVSSGITGSTNTQTDPESKRITEAEKTNNNTAPAEVNENNAGIYYFGSHSEIIEIAGKDSKFYLIFYNVEKNRITEKSRTAIYDFTFHTKTASYTNNVILPASAQYSINGKKYHLFYLGQNIASVIDFAVSVDQVIKNTKESNILRENDKGTYLPEIKFDKYFSHSSDREFTVSDLLSIVGRYESNVYYHYDDYSLEFIDVYEIDDRIKLKKLNEKLVLDISVCRFDHRFLYTFPNRDEHPVRDDHKSFRNGDTYGLLAGIHGKDFFLLFNHVILPESHFCTNFILDKNTLYFVHFNGNYNQYYMIRSTLRKTL